MKDFIKFIVKIALVVALATFGYKLVFNVLWKWDKGPRAYDDAYQNALLRQYNALADEDRESKVIVFGASYVPFGIDVDTLTSVTGKDSQILGIEAGIGIPVLIDILYKTAKPGDVIVYMLGKSNSSNGDFMTLSAAFESDKELLKWYWDSQGDSIDFYKNKMIWRKMYSLIAAPIIEDVRYSITHKDQVYSIDSFDEKGNMTGYREGTRISTYVEPSGTLKFEEIDLDTMNKLNEFYVWCQENDITFVIAYAMTIDGSLNETDESLALFHKEMSDYMEADILLTPQDYFLPVTDFFNHEAHLNTEGAIKYSTILGNALNEYLKGDKNKVVIEAK